MLRLALALPLLLAATPALAGDVFAQAPVAAVTVYQDGALLTRRATLDLPAGESLVFLTFAGIDDLDALPRIAAPAGVEIGALGLRSGVSVDREALFTPAQTAGFAALEAAKAAVAAKQDEIATARAEAAALQARLDFLAAVKPGRRMSADEIVATADMLAGQTAATTAKLVAAKAALRPLEKALEKLTEAEKAAEKAFARLSPPEAVENMLSVDVRHDAAGPVTLEFTEPSYDAGWGMDYDLNLDTRTGALSIARILMVSQRTGESWSGVALTLSTARPGDSIAPRPVAPDLARIAKPQPVPRGTAGGVASMAPPMVEPAPMVETAMKAAPVQIEGESITYVYPDPVSLVSGDGAELALDKLDFSAEVSLEASPRRDETAFTMARFTNDTREPILPGQANFLRDGHLSGRGEIALIPAGAEETLGFGPVEGIRLATVFERNEEGGSGLISKSNTRDQRITFSVENLTGETQKVRALFPLTFSEQQDLRVRVSAEPEPDETDIDARRGVSAWSLTLAPGEKREVHLRVQLDWPEGQDLVWHP